MSKQLSKQVFGVPTLETASRIDDSDNALAVHAAVYRADSKLMELRVQYETECSRIRAAMLAEIAELELKEGAAA